MEQAINYRFVKHCLKYKFIPIFHLKRTHLSKSGWLILEVKYVLIDLSAIPELLVHSPLRHCESPNTMPKFYSK